MVADVVFLLKKKKDKSLYSESISTSRAGAEKSPSSEGEGTAHTLAGVTRAGGLRGPSGLRSLVLRSGPRSPGRCASIELALPCSLDARPHRVVDGSFLTRRCARIEDSMGFS